MKEYIKDYYNMEDKNDYLDSKTKQQITELLRELGYTQRIEIVFN